MNWGTILFFFFVGVALASDHQKELRVIAHIESSSGKNLNHPVIESGMHKGHRASGHYGLMPLTVIDLVSKDDLLKMEYGYLLDLPPQEITEEINQDKVMDKTIATAFWTKLRKKYGPRRSAYAWYHGPARAKHIDQLEMEQAPYVKKFTREMERLKNESEIKRKGSLHVSTSR